MTFVGSYEGQISMQGKFGVANNKLIKGGAHSILKGTRAYFIYNAPSGQASSLNINIGGATTGIEQAEVAVQAVDGVYNLQGVCVRKGTSFRTVCPRASILSTERNAWCANLTQSHKKAGVSDRSDTSAFNIIV